MMNRLVNIDQLKGLGILLVVIGHIFFFSLGQTQNMLLLDMLSFVHMPLFMFLSGYVAYKVIPGGSLKKMYWNKAISLLLPFLITGGLYAVVHGNLHNLFFKPMKMGYWFTFTLFEIFCIYYPFAVMSQKWNKKNLWWVDVFIFGVAWVGIEFIRVTDLLPPMVKDLVAPQNLEYFRYFIFGVFCRKYQVLNRLVSNNNACFTLMLILFVVLFFLFEKYRYVNYVSLLLQAVSGIWCLFYLITRYSTTMPFGNQLAFMGRRSLDIYVIHYFLLLNLSEFIPPIFANVLINNVLLQIFIPLILSLMVISVSLVISQIIRSSDVLALLMLGIRKKAWSIL